MQERSSSAATTRNEYSDEVGQIRGRIQEALKRARAAEHLSQADFGRRVGLSRYTINRLETGAVDLSLTVANKLRDIPSLSGLNDLVRLREQARGNGPVLSDHRDLAVQRLLEAPGIHRVRVVLVDDLDLMSMIEPLLGARVVVEVVVPTVRRTEALFRKTSSEWLDRIQSQIAHLTRLVSAEGSPVAVYESDDVLFNVVLVESVLGTDLAVWPVPPTQSSAASFPVSSSSDPGLSRELDEYLQGLKGDSAPLRLNQVVVRRDDLHLAQPPIASFFTRGEDDEGEVPDSSGFPVSLILAHAVSERAHYPLARRVIAYNRPYKPDDQFRISLFSTAILEVDLVSAARSDRGGPQLDSASRYFRTSRDGFAAAQAIYSVLGGETVLDGEVYRYAANRHLRERFSLDIPVEHFKQLELPEHLRVIPKGEGRAPIFPTLFVIDLTALAYDSGLPIRRIIDLSHTEAHGYEDFLEDSPSINDFLAHAKVDNWLRDTLQTLKIAPR